jgi:hypothetical protein
VAVGRGMSHGMMIGNLPTPLIAPDQNSGAGDSRKS